MADPRSEEQRRADDLAGLEHGLEVWRKKASEARDEAMELRVEHKRMCNIIAQQQADLAHLAADKVKVLEKVDALTKENGRLTMDNEILRRRLDEMTPRDTIPGFHRTHAQMGKGQWRYWAPLPDGRWLWYPIWVPDEDAEELDNE